jgi:hypothetical protein
MNALKLLIILAISVIGLVGCATVQPSTVTSTVTSFYTPGFAPSGSIAVVAASEEIAASLEFAHYKPLLETKFSSIGYSIESDPRKAKHIAFLSYGIDDGKNQTVSTPVYGVTGGGSTVTTGYIGATNFGATRYSMPSYGVVGSSSSNVTTYTRAIAIDIVKAESFSSDNRPQKVYENRTKSIGTCSTVASIFKIMLDAIFSIFPGESGNTKDITVTLEKSPC